MKKILLNALLVFIPIKSWRKRIRARLLSPDYALQKKYQRWDNDSFSQATIQPQQVLIVELNSYHAEVIPGVVHHFQEIGYTVDVFLRHEFHQDSPFVNFPPEKQPRIFYGTTKHLIKLLHLPKTTQYNHIFFNSSAYHSDKLGRQEIAQLLAQSPVVKENIPVHLMEHRLDIYQQKHPSSTTTTLKKLFTLSGFRQTTLMTPYYFGTHENTPKASSGKIIFAVIGNIRIAQNSLPMLINAVNKARQRSTTPFEILFIGSGDSILQKALSKHPNIAPYFHATGRATYQAMYKLIESADYILVPHHRNLSEHQHYKDNTISGSKQLIFGFQKPTLLMPEFAHAFDLNETQALFYTEETLDEKILEALALSPCEYEKKCQSLREKYISDSQLSQKNLKQVLSPKSIDKILPLTDNLTS